MLRYAPFFLLYIMRPDGMIVIVSYESAKPVSLE